MFTFDPCAFLSKCQTKPDQGVVGLKHSHFNLFSHPAVHSCTSFLYE